MRGVLILGFLASCAAGGFAANASRGTDAEALAQARQEARQANARVRQLERRASQATGAAARARAESEALAARIQAAEAELTEAERRIALIEAMREAQRAHVAEREQPLIRLSAALQTMSRRPAALALVQPGSVEETVRVRSLLAATLPEIRRRTTALRAEVARSDRLRGQLDQARRALAASRDELQQRRIDLARFESEQRTRSEQLAGLALTESDRALALDEGARALASVVGTRQFQDRLEASLAGLPGPLPRPPGVAVTDPPPQRLAYRLPVQGQLLTGVGEISEAGVHARGLTFRTAADSPVAAPAGGRVVYAAPFRDYDYVVIIDHGRGWSSVITDLASLQVRTTQTVRRGSILGRTGAGQPTITVELRRNGRPVPFAQLIAG